MLILRHIENIIITNPQRTKRKEKYENTQIIRL
jgi:hypothetical protein